MKAKEELEGKLSLQIEYLAELNQNLNSEIAYLNVTIYVSPTV